MRSLAHGVARVAVVIGVTAVAVLGFGSAAGAHVTVNPSSATQGGYAKLTFRVPNEKATASTTILEVVFPEDAPIPSVSVKPVPGWTAQVQRRTLSEPIDGGHGEQISEVVGSIVWTASAGAEIGPGQFQEFDVSLGPLPAVDQMIFKALQTYADGDVVRWIDEPSTDPAVHLEHPAPVLRLAPAGGAQDSASASDTGSSNGVAVGFGLAGAVLGLAGLILGLLAFRRAAGQGQAG
jgi:uncharacterized protein YcnI